MWKHRPNLTQFLHRDNRGLSGYMPFWLAFRCLYPAAGLPQAGSINKVSDTSIVQFHRVVYKMPYRTRAGVAVSPLLVTKGDRVWTSLSGFLQCSSVWR
jgi:hypothetical protein